MPRTTSSGSPANHDKTVAKGAAVQGLGNVGRLLVPVFFLIATRWYGPEIIGLYLTAFKIVEIGISITVSGFNTAVLMFASRYADKQDKREATYQMLANSVAITGLICGMMIALAHWLGPTLLREHFPLEEVPRAVTLLVWTIPLQAISSLVVSATKSTLSMKWDAVINGFLHPATLLFFCVGAYWISPDINGLLVGHLLSKIVVAIFALVVFGRLFSFAELGHHLIHFRWFKGLVAFAIPQNLNMTFNTFITNVDIVMLGMFGTDPARIAFYGMAAEIVRNIRQIKIAFSNAFAPVIARLHEAGEIEGLSRLFNRVSSWTLTLGIAAALVVAAMRQDLLMLFHDTFDKDNRFMLVLLVAPLLSCGWGIAGNIIVMTGHSVWNLVNSTSVAFINATLNFVLIPRYGLYGAAVATASAAIIVTLMQLVEARVILGVRASLKELVRPLTAAAPAAALCAVWEWAGLGTDLWMRLLSCGLAVVVYLGMLVALGLTEKEKELIAGPFKRFCRRT